jgi:predicted metal-dependent hydrolase
MTKGELKFNEIKDEYLKHYERTSGKKLDKLYYQDGYVHMVRTMLSKHQISEFETMLATLKERPDFIRAENKKWVAKLVTVSLTTRIIVEEGTTDEDILAKAESALKELARTELSENLDKIEDDTECPYGTFKTDKQTD